MAKKTAAAAPAGQKSEAPAAEANGSATRQPRRGCSACRNFVAGFLLGASLFLIAAVWALTLGREQLGTLLTEVNSIAADFGIAAKDAPLFPVACLTSPLPAIEGAVTDVGAPVAGDASCAARISDIRKELEAVHSADLARAAADAREAAEQGETTCERRVAAIRQELEADQSKQCSSGLPAVAEQHPQDGGAAHDCKVEMATHETKILDEARASCEGSLAEVRSQVQDGCETRISAMAAQLEESRGAEDGCKTQISAMAAQLEESRGAEAGCEGRVTELAELLKESGRRTEAQEPPRASAEWPECVERGVVFRGHGQFADFEDLAALFGDAASGCWNGQCHNSDKFETPRIEDCAQACASLDRCRFWSHGEQDGLAQCFLRASDGGREGADGFIAGAKGCSPPPLTFSPSQAALAVLDSQKLRGCDQGAGAACPSLHDGMRTWLYGIENLKLVMEGAADDQLGGHLEQIWADAVAFVNTDDGAQGLESLYPIAVQNNRMVFEALRGFLSEQDATPVNHLDASLPPPVRGLLCEGANSCQV